MNEIILAALLLVALVLLGLLAFLLGIQHERKAWNGLIERGVIPKPGFTKKMRP